MSEKDQLSTGLGRLCLVLLLAIFGLAVLSALPSLASGATITNDRPLLFSFDGSDSDIGPFTNPEEIAVNQTTGDIYVANLAGSGKGPGPFDAQRAICRFNSSGQAQSFAAIGTPCLTGAATPGGSFGVDGYFETGTFFSSVAVDNSSANPGRIYISEGEGPIHAFDPDGTYRWTLPRESVSPCHLTVDAGGQLWVIDLGNRRARQFATTGSPPIETSSFALPAGTEPCYPAIDQSGNVYIADYWQGSPLGIRKYVGGVQDSIVSSTAARALTVDQSSTAGHLFALHDTEPLVTFSEYDSTGALLGTFGHDLLGDGFSIAYNPALDWVYVLDRRESHQVKVFGPRASGTAPDVSCQSTDEVGLHSARANCTINPGSLPHSYHFEWKQGTGPSWATADASAEQSVEPTDETPHSVSLLIEQIHGKALRSNTTYQVRLVGTNTETHLRSYSTPSTFTTLTPPPATISQCSLSDVGPEAASISCLVDPQEEESDWRLLRRLLPGGGTQASCEAFSDTEFEQIAQGTIPAEEPDTVVIEADLEGLLPAQHYCIRLLAANPGGGDAANLVLTTSAIPPTDAAAAFAAPRTDTTARINARLNPQGESDVTYHFELSEDGGSSWRPLPEQVSSTDAREAILVADELTGLKPATTYDFRLAAASNAGGEADGLPSPPVAFKTRAPSEVDLPPPAYGRPGERGIELVNSPDKGNQNVLAEGPRSRGGSPPMSEDGDRVLWFILAGGPGAPNGTQSTFLATRTASGWVSEPTAPPAPEQSGAGNFLYQMMNATPDFKTFLFVTQFATGFAEPPPPIGIARVQDRHQEGLRSFDQTVKGLEDLSDLTDDARHVVLADPLTGRLVDIGAPDAPELISILPDGAPAACPLDTVSDPFGKHQLWHHGYHWIATTDASRVYFTVRPNMPSPDQDECDSTEARGLYVRNRDAAQTTLIDPASPDFIRATPDGRAAYFRTASALDPIDTNATRDIYRWEEGAGQSSCLTCVHPESRVAAEGQFSSILVSDDFSHVYFFSPRVLVPGMGSEGDSNLYSLSGGELHFVGVTDKTALTSSGGGGGPELSSDGTTLLFRSLANPTLSADPLPPECFRPVDGDQEVLAACTQLYRYDARDGSVECLSCRHRASTVHSVGSPGRDGNASRLSANGSTAAFVTRAALLPADVNDDSDVYEWRNGVRRLITDGVSDFPTGYAAPQVMAVDRDGTSILFGVVPPPGGLTGHEDDNLLNLYSARIGGGFPPPGRPERCSEDACQGPLPVPPFTPQPASAVFSGRGNVAKKPDRRRRSRCARLRGPAKKRCRSKRRHANAGKGHGSR